MHALRGTLQAQVHFADVPNDAFTIHGPLPLAANPIALREVSTRQVFDAVYGQVFWQTCKGEHLLTHCPASTLPLAKADGSLGQH